MAFARRYFCLNLTAIPKGFGVTMLALLILAIIGLTPTLGSVVAHTTDDSAAALSISESLEESRETVGANAPCVIHAVCVAIVATPPAIGPFEYIGTKQRLALILSILRAAMPPLLHPPITL